MVEISTGKNIKSKTDKIIIAAKGTEIAAQLNDTEKDLTACIKKQTAEDKIKIFDLGEYKLLSVVTAAKQTPLQWQLLGGEIYKHISNCREIKIEIIGQSEESACNLAFGIETAAYRFDKYFTAKPLSFYPKLEKISLINLKNTENYKSYAALANSIRYARDLINEPANEMTPEIMSADIKRLEYLGLEVEILEESAMKELGFNLALAVAQGSVNRPKIAVIKWRGNPDTADFSVGFVGKGVTFDSGGISIKPAANMHQMKQDMAGAAAITATLKSLALQKVKQNVVAVVGLVENMPSGSAYRPGDIFTSMSGQTVEVLNTDAEGRLVLADCLTYIQKRFKPEYVIDMATLTGAIVIALGSAYAGLFSNNGGLSKQLTTAGNLCGERLWEMPMDKEYDKLMDSAVADMANTSNGIREAGSATAACFLQRFIQKNTKWAHIDIAGVDYSNGSKVLYPKGASAFGVKLLNTFIRKK